MYIPRANEETRIEVMRALAVAHPLATLVTLNQSKGGPELFATHLPLIWDADGSEFGVLRGHVSRANVQWREFDASVDALTIFAGPHHYISPNWYPEKQEHGKVVPTWNYAVVHAYGAMRVIEDGEWMQGFLEKLTGIHEAGFAAPWAVGDAPMEFVEGQKKGIVGVEIPIRRVEGKWKVSQTRSVRDREGTAAGLGELGTEESLAMRDLVVEALEERG